MTSSVNTNLAAMLAGQISANPKALPGDAASTLASIFAQLLEGQIQPSIAVATETPTADERTAVAEYDTVDAVIEDPALLPVATWFAAPPPIPVVNPENGPKMEFPFSKAPPEVLTSDEGPNAPSQAASFGLSAAQEHSASSNALSIATPHAATSSTPGLSVAADAPAKFAALTGTPDPIPTQEPQSNAQPEATPVSLTAESRGPTFAQRLDDAIAPEATLRTPLNSPQWGHQFSDRVVWMLRNDQQVAQINITPPQLGPIQITVNMNGDLASAVFASPHAEVRQAIESALPQLREMLASAGISLGNANVGSQLPQRTPPEPLPTAQPGHENAILASNDRGAETSVSAIQRGRGLVDLFA